MSNTVPIRWAAYYGDQDLLLDFPATWEVRGYPPRGGPDIGEEGIRRALAEPFGTPPLAELARGRRDAVIVVDDLSRPTPADRILPFVLEELVSGGIPPHRISFIMGLASHRPMTRADLIRKLGPCIYEHHAIYNHDPYNNVVYLGTTSLGTPVYINRDFFTADLKLCLGSINPHGGPGFGGGAKLIVPGVAGIETLRFHHSGHGGQRGGLNRLADNTFRADLEEATRMTGLDAIVNAVVNAHRRVAGLFVGDLVAAHRAGVERARQVFATPVPTGVDVGVFNAYPKDQEFNQAGMGFNLWASAPEPIVHEEGTVVLCTACPEGAGIHGLYGIGLRRTDPNSNLAASWAPRGFLLFAPGLSPFALSETARKANFLCSTWPQVRARLEAQHGLGTRVAVFPCSSIQLAEPVAHEMHEVGSGLDF